MLNIIQTFLIRKGLEISQLTNLFHFHFINFHLTLFSLLPLRFMPLNSLILNIILNFLQPLIKYSPIFKLSRYLLPQISKIPRIKSPMNNIIFFTMIFIIRRIKRLTTNISMLLRWCKINLSKWFLSLISLLSITIVLHSLFYFL